MKVALCTLSKALPEDYGRGFLHMARGYLDISGRIHDFQFLAAIDISGVLVSLQ